jgi:cation transport ATPase
MGEFWAILTAGCWACIAGCYAAAARRKLNMLPFVSIVASTAALASAATVLRWNVSTTWQAQTPLVSLMLLSGALGQVSMALNGLAMRAAPTQNSITWTLFQMAMVVPFLWAAVFWGQRVSWCQWVAFAPLLLSLIALMPDGKPASSEVESSLTKWLQFLFAGFSVAGLSQLLSQEAALRQFNDALNLRVPVSLAAGGACLWAMTFLKRQLPTAVYWRIGTMTGLVVATGNVTLFAALDGLTLTGRTYIVFPMAVGGSILLYSLYQMVSRRESFGWRKAFGLICGVAGLILLTSHL